MGIRNYRGKQCPRGRSKVRMWTNSARFRTALGYTVAVAALAVVSSCTGNNRNLESSAEWQAFSKNEARSGAAARFASAKEAAGVDDKTMAAGRDPVVLRLGLSDCLELARTRSFEAVIAGLKAELASARVQAAGAFDDLRLTSSLDYNITEQALETRLTGDTRTREEQTVTKMSVGVLKPFVTGTTVGFSHSANQTDTNSPFNTFDWSSGMALTVKQSLLDGFGVLAHKGNYDAAVGELEALGLDQRRERTSRALAVASAYWSLVMAQDRIAILREQRSGALADLDRVRQQRQRGEALRLDELRAEITVAGHEQELVSAEHDAREASDGLIAAINPEMLYGYALVPGYLLSIEPKHRDVADAAVVPDLHASVQRALETRSDLLASIRRAENAGIRVRQREQGLLPNLTLEGSAALWGFGDDYGETLSDIGEAKNRRYGIKLSFEMPLENTADAAALRTAQAEQEQALWAVRESEVRVIRDVLKSIRSLETAIRAREEAERAAVLAEAELEAAKSSQASGAATSADVRNAQARYTAKKLDQSRAKISVELARLAAIAATGE